MLKVYLTRGSQEQGVWLNLPASPAEMGEAYATLDNIDSENLDTPILVIESSVSNLKRYIHEHDSLEQLNTLAARINKMSDRDADIFSGALDMESINRLEDIMRIANNLQEYKLLPGINTRGSWVSTLWKAEKLIFIKAHGRFWIMNGWL
jgi:hypothetical protein